MNRLHRTGIIGSLLAATLLAACTPADVSYCSKFGVEGTAEYGKCLDYYHQQEVKFDADRGVCELEADATYPPTLYDRGGYARTMGGFGPHGQYYGGQTIHIEPDWYHNRQIDNLRMRIIEPCMQTRGWNSGSSWQAGRHSTTSPKRKTTPAQKLPWQK